MDRLLPKLKPKQAQIVIFIWAQSLTVKPTSNWLNHSFVNVWKVFAYPLNKRQEIKTKC